MAPRPLVLFITFLAGLLPFVSAYAKLSTDSLQRIPDAGDDFHIKNGKILAPILKPRVPDTPGSLEVLQHLVDFFRDSLPEWRLEFQNSSSTTPTSNGKEITFRNLIAVRDPPGTRPGEVGRLTMVAHYDSLQTPEGFIGAIDSAAPCAMLLHAARSVDAALTAKWENMKIDELDVLDADGSRGVQIILMDGEEAFLHWSDTDSIYGARALAEEWEQSFHAAGSAYRTNLSSIELFVLLDLLGAPNVEVPSYFLPTHWAYQAMANIEGRLREMGLFRSSPNHPSKQPKEKHSEKLFLSQADKAVQAFTPSYMGDDHVPFLARGVEILHLIPSRFPSVWHKITDDGEHLDMDVVEDWTKLVTAFIAEYMELDEYMDAEDTRRNWDGTHHEL